MTSLVSDDMYKYIYTHKCVYNVCVCLCMTSLVSDGSRVFLNRSVYVTLYIWSLYVTLYILNLLVY